MLVLPKVVDKIISIFILDMTITGFRFITHLITHLDFL